MEKFIIETRNGDEFIVSKEHGFMLKVITPEKRNEDAYIPYEVVSPVFIEDLKEPEFVWADFETDEEYLAAAFSGTDETVNDCFDFEGVNITYFDDDTLLCNKELWMDAISFYSALRLGKTLIALRCYGYQFEFSELNCSPETLESLNYVKSVDHKLN